MNLDSNRTSRNLAIPSIGIALAVSAVVFFREPVINQDEVVAYILNFSELKWISFSISLALFAVLSAFGRIEQTSNLRIGVVDLSAAALTMWAAFSLLWAPDMGAASLSVSYWLLGAGFFIVARTASRDDAIDIIHWFVLVSLALALIVSLIGGNRFTQNGFGNENFAAEYLSVAGLAGLALWKNGATIARWATRGVVLLAIGYLLVAVPSRLQFVAFAVAALYLLGQRGTGRSRLWLGAVIGLGLIGLATVVAVTGPETFIAGLGQSIQERLQIWANSLILGAHHPVTGGGLGSYYYNYSAFINSYLEVVPVLGQPACPTFDRQPIAAENDAIHLFAELGVVGLIVGVVCGARAYWVLFHVQVEPIVSRLGAALTGLLAVSLFSFPFQNPAPLVLGAIVLGVVASEDARAMVAIDGPRSRRIRIVGMLSIAVVALVIATTTVPELRAKTDFSRGSVAAQRGNVPSAIEYFVAATAHSVRSPKVRIRAYTQALIADPNTRRASLDGLSLEELYALAHSASPSNPLVLDLRLKHILSSSGLQVDLQALEELVAVFKNNSGSTVANPHVIEAALSIQLGDTARAEAALKVAETLIREPLNANDTTNVQNIASLKAQLRR